MAEAGESRVRRRDAARIHRHGTWSTNGGRGSGPHRLRRRELTRVCRILRRPFSKKPPHGPMDGEGAYRFGGTLVEPWHSPGVHGRTSLAMIEYFVQIDEDSAPRAASWRQSPAPPGLAVIGDGFVNAARAAVLIVPSALAQAESNWLLNPRHPDFAKISGCILPGNFVTIRDSSNSYCTWYDSRTSTVFGGKHEFVLHAW
jgi:RES domain-containing protein